MMNESGISPRLRLCTIQFETRCKHTAFNFEVAAFNVEVVLTLNLKNGELSYAILTRGREIK